MNQLHRDTVLVTDVAGRVEAAIAERWKVEGDGLREKIDNLKSRGVDERVISMLHYLRMERNRVIHHPRQMLEDRVKFTEFSETVLPKIEESKSVEDFLGTMIENLVESRFDQMVGKLAKGRLGKTGLLD